MSMIAKSLDVVVLLKLLVAGAGKTYAGLSKELGMSASEIHAAVRRCADAGLIDFEARRPLRKPLEEYLLHGVRYAFPAKRGSLARGIPTAHAAPPLVRKIGLDDLPPVWPDPGGQHQRDMPWNRSTVPCRKPQNETGNFMNCWRWWMPSASAAPANASSREEELKKRLAHASPA